MERRFQQDIEAFSKNGATQKFIAKRYNITKANLPHWGKRFG
jgi:hypothetical protein